MTCLKNRWIAACPLLLSVLVIANLGGGCVGNRQYRLANLQCAVDTRRATEYVGSSNACVEVGSDYTLGFVELDDQGWLWDRKQIDTITNRFAAEMQTNGLIIVTFVHGWMHNAERKDTNLRDFRAHMLSPLAAMESTAAEAQHRAARRVVGVYVGWRGRSASIPGISLGTFWTRKAAAERVGHGGVIEILCELEKLRDTSNSMNKNVTGSSNRMPTKMITIGHSFGGDVVYSATAPILAERMIRNEQSGAKAETPKSLGDLVVLINPAFEAARFETIHRLAAASQCPQTNCTLVVFTSKHDLATKVAFRAGRWVSTIGQAHRDSRQASANRIAIGHYQPYIGFDLASSADRNEENRRDIAKLLLAQKQLKQHADGSRFQPGETFHFKHGTLTCRSAAAQSGSVYVVAVDPKLVPDHSSIDHGDFLRCVAEFAVVFAGGNR